MSRIAVVTDLIFSTKITGTAKALGGQVQVARSLDALRQKLDAACEAAATGTPPTEAASGVPLVIVDLNSTGVDTVEAVRVAKAHRAAPRVVAFLSHVQAELAVAAREAGADQVLARSAFVDRLPELVRPA